MGRTVQSAMSKEVNRAEGGRRRAEGGGRGAWGHGAGGAWEKKLMYLSIEVSRCLGKTWNLKRGT